MNHDDFDKIIIKLKLLTFQNLLGTRLKMDQNTETGLRNSRSILHDIFDIVSHLILYVLNYPVKEPQLTQQNPTSNSNKLRETSKK